MCYLVWSLLSFAPVAHFIWLRYDHRPRVVLALLCHRFLHLTSITPLHLIVHVVSPSAPRLKMLTTHNHPQPPTNTPHLTSRVAQDALV